MLPCVSFKNCETSGAMKQISFEINLNFSVEKYLSGGIMINSLIRRNRKTSKIQKLKQLRSTKIVSIFFKAIFEKLVQTKGRWWPGIHLRNWNKWQVCSWRLGGTPTTKIWSSDSSGGKNNTTFHKQRHVFKFVILV